MLLIKKKESFSSFCERYSHQWPREDKQTIEALSTSAIGVCNRRNIYAQERQSMRAQEPLLIHENQIYLYGPIGAWEDEVGFENLFHAFEAVEGDPVHLRINSPGGDVMEGIAMMNYLRRQERSTVMHIDSQALSMGASIALAGSTRVMAENAKMMVHNPTTIAMGDFREFERQAAVLHDLTGDIANLISSTGNIDFNQAFALVDDETWFNAEQAMEIGIVSAIEHPLAEDQVNAMMAEAAARVDLKSLKTGAGDQSRLIAAHKEDAPVDELAARLGRILQFIDGIVRTAR